MPCWTTSTTTVDLDATGVDFDRMVAAANEHNIGIERVDGRIQLRDYYRREAGEVERLVKQSYSRLTVETGLKKFGFRVQSTRTEQRQGVGQVNVLKVGR